MKGLELVGICFGLYIAMNISVIGGIRGIPRHFMKCQISVDAYNSLRYIYAY